MDIVISILYSFFIINISIPILMGTSTLISVVQFLGNTFKKDTENNIRGKKRKEIERQRGGEGIEQDR